MRGIVGLQGDAGARLDGAGLKTLEPHGGGRGDVGAQRPPQLAGGSGSCPATRAGPGQGDEVVAAEVMPIPAPSTGRRRSGPAVVRRPTRRRTSAWIRQRPSFHGVARSATSTTTSHAGPRAGGDRTGQVDEPGPTGCRRSPRRPSLVTARPVQQGRPRRRSGRGTLPTRSKSTSRRSERAGRRGVPRTVKTRAVRPGARPPLLLAAEHREADVSAVPLGEEHPPRLLCREATNCWQTRS